MTNDVGILETPRHRAEAGIEGRLEQLLASDPQVAGAVPDPAVTRAKLAPGLNLAAVMTICFEGYKDRPALASRAVEIVTDPATGRRSRSLLNYFEAETYIALWRRIMNLASYWAQAPGRALAVDDIVGFLGFAGTDYVISDVAASYLGCVTVPLPNHVPLAQLSPIVADLAPRWIAVSLEYLDVVTELALANDSIKGIVLFDYRSDVDDERELFEASQQRLANAGKTDVIITLLEACAIGAKRPPAPAYVADDSDKRLSTIYYTSGSTGVPNGAMHLEGVVKTIWCMPEAVPTLTVLYQPLCHSSGRTSVASVLGCGGTIFFPGKSDLSTLIEDMGIVRPTVMRFVPRVLEMLHQSYLVELDRRGSHTNTLDQGEDEFALEFGKRVLGGRMLFAAFGGAALSPELASFARRCLGFPLTNTFGTSETLPVLNNGKLISPPVLDYKLEDVPELGYFKTDKPYPRGELLLKSRFMMIGYFKRPEVTASVFDADGFYRTGDVMALIGPDELAYVDRRNNVMKLAQGEFVAISRLESIFTSGHPFIKQAYLYATSERSYMLAVIVPNEEILAETSIDRNDAAAVKAALREAIKEIAREHHLNSYEVPRDFIVEWEPFTTANGLLGGVGKHQRPRLNERYGARLEAMYGDIAAARAEDLRRLASNGRNAPVIETVGAAVQATLGIEKLDLSKRVSFSELGGDSLSALSCSLLLEEIYNIEIPVSVINNPAGSLQHLASFIERARDGSVLRPTFASVHGRDATRVHAADLTLDKFLDAGDLQAAHDALPPAKDIRTVLLTGANGFLGRFLCLEWLERMAPVGGKVICIARGEDDQAAYRRIANIFGGPDPALQRRFEELAADHLQVFAGDIGEPDLGLRPADFEMLAEQVDLIVHPAAHVNHVLSYAQLFGSNVVGTAQLIRLALRRRIKPVVNFSTAGIAFLSGAESIDEDVDIRRFLPSLPIDNTGYAEGYSTTKWAGEVLLRDAHDRFGLPVSVIRPGMILAHSRYRGQINVPDMFSRWLLSTIQTGLAPRSYYSNGGDGAHYTGLPADFIAAAVAEIGLANKTDYQSYHVINPHDDNISMDSFVDWMIAQGTAIEKIDDYDKWYRQFEMALRGLPETQRQHSSLPLIHQFKEPAPGGSDLAVPTVRFQQAVRKHGIGAEGEIPRFSEAFLNKCLEDLRSLNLL